MTKNTKQMQGDEVRIGWTIGSAPLALRGIRFADGPEGGTPPAPAPAPPAPAPAPPAPPAPAPVQERTYSADHVSGLRREAQSYREAKEATEKSLADLQAKYDTDTAELAQLRQEKAEQARVQALTTAANGVADVAMLLDSQAFAAASADTDISNADALAKVIGDFVEKNPRFAVAPQQGRPAPRQQSVPVGAGGPKGGPGSLGSALNAHFAAQR